MIAPSKMRIMSTAERLSEQRQPFCLQITEPYPAIFFRHIGRVVGGDRRIPSYSGDYRYAREDKDVDVQLLLFESFGGIGRGVRKILRKAADVLQNKLTRHAGPVSTSMR